MLRQAIGQIPADRRDDLLITCDGAGASHALIEWLDSLDRAPGRQVQYSVGFDVDEYVRAAASRRRPDWWWLPCLSNTTGNLVEGLECTEITDLLQAQLRDLDWPQSMRVIVRRRKLYEHEQPTLFDTNGYRYSCFVTNTPATAAVLLPRTLTRHLPFLADQLESKLYRWARVRTLFGESECQLCQPS